MKPERKAISLVLKSPEGKILTTKRSMKKDSFSGFWSLPSTYLTENESAKSAANRLVKQKLGLTEVKLLDKPIGVGIDKREKYVLRMEDFQVANYNGQFYLNTQEYSEMRWVEPKELKELLRKENNGQMGECTRVFLKSESLL